MKQAYLLSGAPGVGKTTIIKQAVNMLKGKAGGFYTQEIRHRGLREGFEILTLDGASAILAHTNIDSHCRISKYGINTKNLDMVGVSALRRAIHECDIVVVDEIGKIELFSSAFRNVVLEALNSRKKLLGTIMLPPHPWANLIKQDQRVKVLQVSRANHQQILEEIKIWLENE